MKEWKYKQLKEDGYRIENARINSVDLSMADYGALCLEMGVKARSLCVTYGMIAIGKGYLGAEEFSGDERGIEYLMRIMDVVGVDKFNDLSGKYIRIAHRGLGSSLKIIGNIIEDRWFDASSFFEDQDGDGNEHTDNS